MFAAAFVILAVLCCPAVVRAQSPGYAAATVTIGFAPAAGLTEGRGATIAFSNALDVTPSGGRGVTIGFGVPPPAATKLGKPRNAAFNADPVNTATGNFVFDHTDLSLPGRGIGLAFRRYYNSLDATTGPLGPGWNHSYNIALTRSNADQSVQVRWGDGHVDFYDFHGGSYDQRYAGVFDTLAVDGDGSYTITQKSQTRYHFTAAGRLDSIADRNGNAVALMYDGNGRLSRVQEPGGRFIDFSYDGAGRLTLLTDPLPRVVAFAYDGTGHLARTHLING